MAAPGVGTLFLAIRVIDSLPTTPARKRAPTPSCPLHLCCLRGGDVALQLCFERLDVAESLNVSQPGEKVNLQGLAVKRTLETDQMHFDLQPQLVERWIRPDIDGCGERLSRRQRPTGVD